MRRQRTRALAIDEFEFSESGLEGQLESVPLFWRNGDVREQARNRHGCAPLGAGGSAIGLSATDAYGQSLGR